MTQICLIYGCSPKIINEFEKYTAQGHLKIHDFFVSVILKSGDMPFNQFCDFRGLYRNVICFLVCSSWPEGSWYEQ